MKNIELKSIRLNDGNPRKIRDSKLDQLAASIKAFPKMMELRPIVVDNEGVIIGGNMRYRALIQLGYKSIPQSWIKRASDLTKEERDQFVIKDNVSFGEWDYSILDQDYLSSDLYEWGLDIEFDNKNKDKVLLDDGFEGASKRQTSIRPGDLIEIGNHRILCGDSSNIEDVMRLMNNCKADMVFTDPPYGVDYVGKTKEKLTIQSDSLSPKELKEKVKQWFDCIDQSIRPGAYLLATVPAAPLHLIFAQDWLDRGWLRQIMVWNKSSMVFGHSEYHYKHEPILFGWKTGGTRRKSTDRTKTTVWDFDRPSRSEDHPTMKPVDMWVYGIANHTKKGDLVYEPFGGSGTTMIACQNIDRICYALEIDPIYCQVIIDRMIKLDPGIDVFINGKKYISKTQ